MLKFIYVFQYSVYCILAYGVMRVFFIWIVIFLSPTIGFGAGVLFYGSKPFAKPQLLSTEQREQGFGGIQTNIIDTLRRSELKARLEPSTQMFNCLNQCFYAAVDKQHTLPKAFTPALITTDLKGGGRLTIETDKALARMFDDLNKAGIDVEITSAHRSFNVQYKVYENWKRIIRSRDSTLSAEEIALQANRIAALPGHSEHQLGTTVDLNTVGALPLLQEGNESLYAFIAANAHAYGFVVSYPEDSEDLTGYVYEPWHVRYVGVDVATNLFNTKLLLNNFLRSQGYSD